MINNQRFVFQNRLVEDGKRNGYDLRLVEVLLGKFGHSKRRDLKHIEHISAITIVPD